MPDLEQSIRERAYELWAQGGRQDGDADALARCTARGPKRVARRDWSRLRR
jgi:Protein of unknown function (DUF2934)